MDYSGPTEYTVTAKLPIIGSTIFTEILHDRARAHFPYQENDAFSGCLTCSDAAMVEVKVGRNNR